MTTEEDRERRILDLLDRSLVLPEGEQREFLLRESADDPLIRERVLRIYDTVREPERALSQGGALQFHDADQVPEEIGSYRVLGELGRGGMGIVCHGRRADQDFEHEVAIKIVKHEIANDRLIQRLRAERRAMARLRHPGIAHFYDGGELDDGRPYLIMEYVDDGLSLDSYIEKHRPDIDERLRLFLDICDAVRYAHQNLVIHRDLAPGNVLVTREGKPKLIDFGISHDLSDSSDDEPESVSRLTRTTGYAAPERLAGESSTLSDVFSLGVILREMVTGQDALPNTDLNAILDKATAPDPEERYASVDAMIDDVKRYRRSQPVAAVNGGTLYVMSRFIRRHRLPVALGATLILGTAIGTMLLWALLLRAQGAEEQATERFNDVRRLASLLLFDVHDEVSKLEGSTTVRNLLTETGVTYLDSLSAQGDTPTSLRVEIAQGYKRLSDVLGNPRNSNLGQREQAGILLTRAKAEIDAARALAPLDPDVLLAYADITFANGMHEGLSNNDFALAGSMLLDTRTTLARLSDIRELPLEGQIIDAQTDVTIGYFQRSLGDIESAVTEISLGLGKFHDLAAEYPEDNTIAMGLGRAYTTLGEALSWQAYYDNGGNISPDNVADYASAVTHLSQGVIVLNSLIEASDASLDTKMQLIIARLKRANTTCYLEGHRDDGVTDLLSAMELAEALIESDARDDRVYEHLSHLNVQLADCYHQMGRLDDALPVFETTLRRRRAQLARAPDNASLVANLANTLFVLTGFQQSTNNPRKVCETATELDRLWQHYDQKHGTFNSINATERVQIQEMLDQCPEQKP
ncbi:MAG: serine/threonine-protein kinase [Woeseiaceae bacterium]|nr:serine/threonine-protein kinase [Woeseiaceae bacterium]